MTKSPITRRRPPQAHPEYRNAQRDSVSLSAFIKRALMFCLFVLTMPLAAQTGPDLTEALVDQRIAALLKGGAADSDESLRTYQATKSWLASTTSHTSDAAKYIGELTEAPRREAKIQARLDAMESKQDVVESLGTLSGQELETELTLTQTALRDAREARDVLNRQLAARESNAQAIRIRMDEIAIRLEALPDRGTVVDSSAAPSITEASQWLVRAEQVSLREERRAQSAQLDSQPVRYSALSVERAELQIQIAKLAQRAVQLSERLRSERRTTAEQEPLDLASDSPVYPLGQQYRTDNEALDEQRLALESRLAEVKAERQKVKRAIRILNERFARARRVVNFATASDVLGEVLLAYWEELNSVQLDNSRKEIPRQVGDSVISRIGYEENLEDLVSTSTYLNAALNDAGLDPGSVPQAEREVLLEVLYARREMLRSIIATEYDFVDTLSELETNYERHAQGIAEYKRFLDPLVLWIPSGAPLWKADFKQIPQEVPVLLRSVASIEVSLRAVFLSSAVLALILLLSSTRLRDYQHTRNKLISRPREDSIRFTLVALVVSALRAAPPALIVVALTSLFSADTGASATALASLLYHVATWVFAAKLLNILCEEAGVARSHFQWNTQLCDRLQRESTWFLRWLLPGLAFASVLYRLNDAAPLLGRLAMLAVALWIALHIARNLVSAAKESSTTKLPTYENRVQLILVVVFITVAIGVVSGLRFSVNFVIVALMDTLEASIALAIAHSFLLRWLLGARRRLRFEQLLAARQVRSEQPSSAIGAVEEDQANLAEIGEETRQLLNAATIVVALSILYYLWAPILPVFEVMSAITLWTSTSMVAGEAVVYRITLDVMVFVILLISITVYAARKLPALVELVLRARTDVSAGARYTVSTLLNYVILGTGILVALSGLGLDWSKLQWLVAALGVGIGFGLQEIVANFISGLIILFERPISVGDIITVGDQDGVVTRIRIRATTIRDWDNKELLIPNKEIITGRLLNWSLSDTRLRISLPVGVAYGSDAALALKILAETVADDERVMEDPAPSIIFSGFGDSSLDLVCRFYIDDIDNLWPVKTGLHLEIYRRFEKAGIVISFPQRDVHLDSEKPFRISIDPGPAAV